MRLHRVKINRGSVVFTFGFDEPHFSLLMKELRESEHRELNLMAENMKQRLMDLACSSVPGGPRSFRRKIAP